MSDNSNTIPEALDLVTKLFLAEFTYVSVVLLEGESAPMPGSTWARLTLRHRDAGQETLGGPGQRRFERNAVAIVQLFVPENTGTKNLNTLVQQAMNVFEGRSLPGTSIRFGKVSPEDRGADKQWTAANVEAEFTYTERK